jgi:hypothetical protein
MAPYHARNDAGRRRGILRAPFPPDKAAMSQIFRFNAPLRAARAVFISSKAGA